jgi:hypothetical protein
MSENTIESPELDCEQYTDDAEKYDACQKFTAAVEAFRKAQEEWNSLFEKGETEMSTKENIEVTDEPEIVEVAASEVTKVEASAEEVVEETVEVEAAAEEVIEEVEASEEVTDEAEVEVEASAETEVTEEVEALAESVETEEVEVEEVEVEVEASTEEIEETVEIEASSDVDPTAELKALIDQANADIEALKLEKASLSAELSVLKADNEAMTTAEHDRLLGVAMSADPNADETWLATMGNAELEMYIETVERVSAPAVGAKRKSVKKESTVELSAPEVADAPKVVAKELTGIDATEAMISFMSKSQ